MSRELCHNVVLGVGGGRVNMSCQHTDKIKNCPCSTVNSESRGKTKNNQQKITGEKFLLVFL